MKKYMFYISFLIALTFVGCAKNVAEDGVIFKTSPEFSDEYLVGLDYGGDSWGELYDCIDARIIICTNNDVLIYMPTDVRAQAESLELVETLTLTDEQYANIEKGLDREKLYSLKIESDDEVCDGEVYALILYDKEQNILKSCGAYMPITEEFWTMYHAIIDNIPSDRILEIREEQVNLLRNRDQNLSDEHQ